jgi:hypothetical protein
MARRPVCRHERKGEQAEVEKDYPKPFESAAVCECYTDEERNGSQLNKRHDSEVEIIEGQVKREWKCSRRYSGPDLGLLRFEFR